MSEERMLRELPEVRTSSSKVVLGVMGVVIGLGLLFCGGVGAYVAWTGPSDESVEVPNPQMLAHFDDDATAPTILAIDLPPGFERVSNRGPLPVTEALSPMKSVIFRRKTDEGAELAMGRVDLLSIPAGINPEKVRGMMLKKLELAGDVSRTFQRVADSIDTKRELTVLGQRASVEITNGTLDISAKRVAKVAGCFSTEKARFAVLYIIPLDEYDEDAILRMFESIQPPSGDSTPEASDSEGHSSADASGGSADEPARAEPADDDKSETGQTTGPADQ
jgi:hypothetical protein